MSSTTIYDATSKYIRIYNDLINKRRFDPYQGAYKEDHHIIPSSLGGGDESSNIVTLSAREHYVAHLLLEKIHRKEKSAWLKMAKALWCMVGFSNKEQRYKVTSKQFEIIRKISAKASSTWMLGAKLITNGTDYTYIKDGESIPIGFWQQGKPKSEETKERMSKTRKNMYRITDGIVTLWINRGESIPDGWRAGHCFITEETKAKIAQKGKGRKFSETTKNNMSKGRKGKFHYNNGTIMKFFFPGEEPEGWVKGKLPKT
jgi:hypothetical protein